MAASPSLMLPIPPPRKSNATASLFLPPPSPVAVTGISNGTNEKPGSLAAAASGTNVSKPTMNKQGKQAPELPPRKSKSGLRSARPSLVPAIGPFRKKQSFDQGNVLASETPSRKNSILPNPPSRTNSTVGGGLSLNLDAMARKASNLTLESLRRPSTNQPSASDVNRRPSAIPFSLRKPSANTETLESRRSEYVNNKTDAGELSARLAFAKVQSQRRVTSQRKKSENLFTKQEMKSIRMAATEAKINWDDDPRLTSDDTSVVSGGSDTQADNSIGGSFKTRFTSFSLNPANNNSSSTLERRKPSTTSLFTMYRENSSKTNTEKKFEFANPHIHEEHQYGMIVFSGGGGSMVLEDDD